MDYFTGIAMLILVLSPVLVPLVITGFHTVGTWRREDHSNAFERSERSRAGETTLA